MPLQVPKEIWLLVDHLFKHALHQVRGRERASATLELSWWPGSSQAPGVYRARLSPVLEALAGCPRVHPPVPTCLTLCGEGDFVHPCGIFDRRTCSRLQACRKSWSRSLTAWTPAFLRQSVSFRDGSQLCWESLSISFSWQGWAPLGPPTTSLKAESVLAKAARGSGSFCMAVPSAGAGILRSMVWRRG